MAVSIKAELELEITKLRANAEKAERLIGKIASNSVSHTARIQTHFTQIVSGGFQGVRAAVAKVASVLADFTSNVLRMATQSLVGVGVAAGIAATSLTAMGAVAVHSAVNSAAGFEQTRLSIAQFVGGLNEADAILKELSGYAVVTPFKTEDLESTTAGLLAAGIAADEVVKVVKELAGVSKDGQMLGELGDALGKGFAKGKYDLEEINKFLERQINLLPALSGVTGLYGADLTKAISAGQVGFAEMEKAIGSMTQAEGQFFGLLEKQSRTGIGLMSTLQSNIAEIRRAFGGPVLESLKPGLQDLIDLANRGIDFAREFGMEAATAGAYVSAALNVLTNEQDLAGLGNSMAAVFKEATRALGVGLLQAADEFGKSLFKNMVHVHDPMFARISGMATRGHAKYQSFWANFALQASQWAAAHNMPWLANNYLAASTELNSEAVGLDKKATEKLNTRIAKMGPFEAHARAFGEAASDPAIEQKFKEGFSSTWELHMKGLGKELERLYGSMAEVRKRVRETYPATPSKEETFANRPATGVQPVDLADSTAEDGAKPARKMLVGSLAAATNLIMGRSAQELILDESKAQTRHLEKIERSLDRMERKNQPAPNAPKPAAAGRFAAG